MGETKNPAPKKARRSPRREAAIPIRVFGTTPRGRDFSEDCVCVKVSRQGAQIRLKHLLMLDETIYITNVKTNQEAAYRVASQVTNPPDAPYADWGVEALDPNEHILE